MSETLFHYTTAVGADSIQESGVIRQSNNPRYTHFGQGVYLSSLHPLLHTTEEISVANKASSSLQNLNKAQVALELKIPRSQVRDIGQRGIWLYPGGDMLLQPYFTGRIYDATSSGNFVER